MTGAATVLLGATLPLVAIVVLLQIGIIRRLRLHAERLYGLESGMLRTPDGLPRGSRAPEVEAFDLGPGLAVLAFFARGCSSCAVEFPALVERSRSLTGAFMAAVVNGPTPDQERPADLGSVVAVFEPELGPVTTAFGVLAFPTYVVVMDGIIVDSVASVHDLSPWVEVAVASAG